MLSVFDSTQGAAVTTSRGTFLGNRGEIEDLFLFSSSLNISVCFYQIIKLNKSQVTATEPGGWGLCLQVGSSHQKASVFIYRNQVLGWSPWTRVRSFPLGA